MKPGVIHMVKVYTCTNDIMDEKRGSSKNDIYVREYVKVIAGLLHTLDNKHNVSKLEPIQEGK